MDDITVLDGLPFDPCELSKKWIMVLLFLRSTSQNYKEAVSIAGTAPFFQQLNIEGKEVNVAGFDKSHGDLSKIMTLSQIISGWKGVKYFVGGRPNSLHSFYETMNCYLLSLACRDYKAYCWDIVDHPFYNDGYSCGIKSQVIEDDDQRHVVSKENPSLLRPCKKLDLRFLSKYHPSTLIDQIQAMAVTLNVDWCPHFDPNATKAIGVK